MRVVAGGGAVVLAHLFDALTAWLAPSSALPRKRLGSSARRPEDSVHLRTYPEIPRWRDAALAEKWERIRRIRRVVTGALELERAQKRIGSSLQAEPVVFATAADIAAFDGLDAPELFITSAARFSEETAPEDAFRLEDVEGVAVTPGLADGAKCERCWRIVPDVAAAPGEAPICGRCDDAVAAAPCAASD